MVEVAGIEPASAIYSKLSHSQAYLIYYHKLEKIGSILNRAHYPVALHLSSSDQGIHCDFLFSQDLYLLF